MDTARQHWEILRKVPTDLVNRIRTFMVIGEQGDGVLFLTEDGSGYWLGMMRFGMEWKHALKPIQLNVPNLASMAHGYEHIVLLDKLGQIYAIGKNDFGQLGQETVDRECHFSPQLVHSLHKRFISVRCGYLHSLALTEDGKVWAWGENSWGQVGVPSSTAKIQPSLHQISELNPHRVVSIECGGLHSLALTDQGEVYAWGANDCGQLGWSDSQLQRPIRIPTLIPVKSIAAGLSHTLLLTQTGEVYACGENEFGQLGLLTFTKSSASLVKVAGLPPISQIASHFHTRISIAMTSERECFAWGYLSNTHSSTPLQFSSIYSTLDSVLSCRLAQRNTPYSVRVEDWECPQRTDFKTQAEPRFSSNRVAGPTPGEDCHQIDAETQAELLSGPNRMGDRIARMFDNSDSNPDLMFELGDQTILAHRSVLQLSSGHFGQLLSISAVRNSPKPDLRLKYPLTTISISDHSYPTFHAYIRFLYTGTFQIPAENLTELIELARTYQESDLEQLCLAQMRFNGSVPNCCLYYKFTHSTCHL